MLGGAAERILLPEGRNRRSEWRSTMAEDTTFEEAAGALVGRLFESAVGAWELLCTHVGLRLGLYHALAAAPDGLTTAHLAKTTGIHPRYAQEWLEQQVTGGFVEVDNPSLAPDERVFTLPAANAAVLLGEQTPFFAAPLADWTAAIPTVLPELMTAYRTGGGFAWGDFGEIVLDGQAAFNRPLFQHALADHLSTHLSDVDARIKADGGKVADVACGYGWSSVALAAAYPDATIDAVDIDEPSVERARAIVDGAGVGDRVSVTVADVTQTNGNGLGGPYELVTIFEALHDMPRPVDALRSIRRSLAPGGAVLIMDENVADSFGEAIGNPVERFMYTASLLCCLPCAMTEQPSAATGTVMRPATLRRYAEEAGFSKVTDLPIEDGFHRYYRLDV
jgi:2-polyprenyl-3-methyl-5-hydroxy-6-metoxy-1,4-benzoquinol methylase